MATEVRPRIDELESLRGLAALLVVFFHIPKWHPALDIRLLDNAYLMVELFFVLSGFVIYNAYAGRIRDRADLARFQFLRFARLYPVHLLFLLVFLGIEYVKFIASTRFGAASPNSGAFVQNDMGAFLENLLLVHAVLPDAELTFNFPSWSISVEFWTYLIFGLLVLKLGPRKEAAFALLAGLALAALLAGQTAGMEPLVKCIGGFFLGCLVAKAATRPLPVRLPPPALIAAVMVVYLSIKSPQHLDILIFPISAALVLSLVTSPAGGAARFLRQRPLLRLGEISYSLYMAHAAVLWVANQVARIYSDRPEWTDGTGRTIPQLTLAETGLAVVLSVTAALVLAAVVHATVERPCRDWSRRVRPTAVPSFTSEA